MTPANDNSAPVARDLRLPRIGLLPLARAGADLAGFDIVAGGVDHAATVTLRRPPASSGKCPGVTGRGNVRAVNAAKAAQLECVLLAFATATAGSVDRIA